MSEEASGPEELPPPGAGNSPGMLLWLAGWAWKRQVEAVLRPLGLTQPQFTVLLTLARLEDARPAAGSSQHQVGVAARMDANTLSQVLRGLEKRALVTRSRAVDRRRWETGLTDSGRTLLAEARVVVATVDAAFFAPMGRGQKVLAASLEHLLACAEGREDREP